jgi:hypothetical protein
MAKQSKPAPSMKAASKKCFNKPKKKKETDIVQCKGISKLFIVLPKNPPEE